MLAHIIARPTIANTTPTTRLWAFRNSDCSSDSLINGEFVARITPIMAMKKPIGIKKEPRALIEIRHIRQADKCSQLDLWLRWVFHNKYEEDSDY